MTKKEHSRIIGVLVYLVMHATGLFAQLDVNQRVEDFNTDGYQDTCISYYDGGSGFGGKYIHLKDGYSGTHFTMSNAGWFSDFKRVMLIPSKLRDPQNAAFLRLIEEELLPELRAMPDPSMEWMIRGTQNHGFLDEHSYFDLWIDPKNEWVAGEFEWPQNYSLRIKLDTIKLFDASIDDEFDEIDANAEAYLVYLAHNHQGMNDTRELELMQMNGRYKIYRTAQGLVASTFDGKFKWIFLSDVHLTGGPEKLRWESMSKVWQQEKYVILLQHLPPGSAYQIYLINVETGFTVRLNHTAVGPNAEFEEPEPVIFEEDQLSIHVGSKRVVLAIGTLITEFERLYESAKRK